MHAEHPGTLVAARQECPLIVGLGDDETFVASAIPAFLAETRHALSIENGEIVTVTSDGATVTKADGSPVEREADEVTWDEDAAEKGGYATFMRKEIDEQPDAVAETIADRLPRRRPRRSLRARHRPRVHQEHAAHRDRRLRHLLPRGPRRPLRDRAVGARAGRDGHRLRVPLPRPGGERGRPRHRHHPIGRDGRHARRHAARARSAAPRSWRSRTSWAARRRATPTPSSTPAPGSRSASPPPRRSLPGRRDVPDRPVGRSAARRAPRRAPGRTDRRAQEAAELDPGDARHASRTR